MILGQLWEKRCEWSAAPVLPFGCLPVVRYALCPMFPRLDRRPRAPPSFSPPPPTPNLGLAPPAVECIRPQNGSSAAAVVHGEKAWQTEQLLGWNRARSLWHEIYHYYLLKHYLVPQLLDQSISGVFLLYLFGLFSQAKNVSNICSHFLNRQYLPPCNKCACSPSNMSNASLKHLHFT